jgi:hypothetical protein
MASYQRASTDAIWRNAWDIDEKGLSYRESEREAVEKGRAALKPFLDLAID